jgi:type II secretory pathway pseudopilin PulG
MILKQHRSPKARTLRSLAAFTMIEIALALAVIGFALVAIIGVLPAGMSVQRDNRESTLVNFDANFLMDAITSGTAGLDDLTNHVIAITNYYTVYKIGPNNVLTLNSSHWIAYTPTGTSSDKAGSGPNVLNTGSNIIALLTTPKYFVSQGDLYSNYITADFRAMTGSLADQGTSQSAQSFAFAYRLYPEIIPYAAAGAPWTNNPEVGQVADNFQANFTQIRLRFRWPIYPNGQVGNSRLTFRTSASGYLAYGPPFLSSSFIPTAFVQPGNYIGVQ